MPRGGSRQGTPGRGYANRTDMGMNPNMSQNTAGTGGMAAPAPQQQPQQAGPPPITRRPEDTPMLTDPTMRPTEPLTAGMATGPGPGPEALSLDPRVTDTVKMKKWLPILKPIIDDPETPESVKLLYRYIRSG